MKRFEKSTLPSNSPIGGISTSETSDPMIAPKAAPTMMPTAMSTMLPFMANSLKSFSMSVLLFRHTMFNAHDRGSLHATLVLSPRLSIVMSGFPLWCNPPQSVSGFFRGAGRGSHSGGGRGRGKKRGMRILRPTVGENAVFWEGCAGRRNPRFFFWGGGGGSLFIGHRGIAPKCHGSVFVAEGG